MARRIERLEAAAGEEALEVVIRRFGARVDPTPREYRSASGRRIIVTEEAADL